MAQQVAEELQLSDPSRHVRFDITPGMRTRGDRALIQALLQNILGNAWKFTRTAPTPLIEFSPEPAQPGSWFVRDNGVGFESKFSGELFSMFRRLHDQAQFEGHGLGLAGARRIVERHGGKIEIQAEPGKGAIVRFWLEECSASEAPSQHDCQ